MVFFTEGGIPLHLELLITFGRLSLITDGGRWPRFPLNPLSLLPILAHSVLALFVVPLPERPPQPHSLIEVLVAYHIPVIHYK